MTSINTSSCMYKILKRIHGVFVKLIFEFKFFFRKHGLSFRHREIKKYKGIYKGNRCFIIATGPSLTMDDLKKLESEITFGMNSLCKVFNDLGWETTFFGIQDWRVYGKLKGYISELRNTTIFIGDVIKRKGKLNTKFCTYPINFLNHRYDNVNLTGDFSDNCFMQVYDGYTIAYSILQIVIYMGFEEIYLIGADCHYSKDKNKQHFKESGQYDPNADSAGKRIIYAYEVAKKYADLNGIKIYNATRGGMLEVFERVDLSQVLND